MLENSQCAARWRWLKKEVALLQTNSVISSLDDSQILQLPTRESLDLQKAQEMILEIGLAIDDMPIWLKSNESVSVAEPDASEENLFRAWDASYNIEDVRDVLRHCRLLRERLQMLRLCRHTTPVGSCRITDSI